MNKTKMTLAVSGGVIGLLVLVMGYLVWGAYSAKTAALEGGEVGDEMVDGLETVLDRARSLSTLSKSHPVYPCAASLKAIESNQTVVADWRGEAAKLAARGDRVFPKTTPAAFKTFIVADAKRLAALPGAVGGALVKPGFAFGPFKDYIAEGKMPAEAQLAELQRQWDDVATLTEMLAGCGIAELVDMQFKVAGQNAEEPSRDAGRGRKARGNGKKKGAKAAEEKQPIAHTYVVSFNAKPPAFVKAMNALETSERFVTVENFTFSRAKDVVAEALGGDEKKQETVFAGRRGRRGRRGGSDPEAAVEAAAEAAAKGGIVTDPLLDAPLQVTMTVTVHDFRSLEEEKEEQK